MRSIPNGTTPSGRGSSLHNVAFIVRSVLTPYGPCLFGRAPGRRTCAALSHCLLVAETPARDLCDRAKHLVVSAMFRRSWRPPSSRVGGSIRVFRRRLDRPRSLGRLSDALPCACGTAVVGVASAGTTPGSALKCRPAEAPLSTWTGHVSSWPRSTSSWIPTKPRYPAVVDLARHARIRPDTSGCAAS